MLKKTARRIKCGKETLLVETWPYWIHWMSSGKMTWLKALPSILPRFSQKKANQFSNTRCIYLYGYGILLKKEINWNFTDTLRIQEFLASRIVVQYYLGLRDAISNIFRYDTGRDSPLPTTILPHIPNVYLMIKIQTWIWTLSPGRTSFHQIVVWEHSLTCWVWKWNEMKCSHILIKSNLYDI